MKTSNLKKGRTNKKLPKPRPFLVELEKKNFKRKTYRKMHKLKKYYTNNNK